MWTRRILAISSILLALLIYLAYRTENTVICKLAVFWVGQDLFSLVRQWLSSHFSIQDYFVYCLPGALWMFTACLLTSNYYLSFRNRKFPLHFIPPFIIIYFEMMQLFGWLNGTFDWLDIAFAILFFAFYRVFISKKPTFDFYQISLLDKQIVTAIYAIIYLSHVSY